MTEANLKKTIQKMHTLWYLDEGPFTNDDNTLKFHSYMEDLFNFAGITETLLKPEDPIEKLRKHLGAKKD